MMAVEKIRSEITLDHGKFDSGLQACIAASKNFGSSVENLTSNFNKGFGMMTAAVGGLAGAIAGSAIVDHFAQIINRLDELGDRADALSITTESLSSLQFAAQMSGSSVEDLTRAITRLNLQVLEAAGGNQTVLATFNAMGISVRDAQGEVKKADQVMMEVADRFATYRDGAEKAALASDLFGNKMGTSLVPFLSQGSAGIRELQQEASDLGVVFGGDVVEAAAAVNDSLDLLGSLVTGVSTNIMASFLPALAETVMQFVAATQASEGFLDGLRLLLGQSSGDWDKPRERIQALGEELQKQRDQLKTFEFGQWEGQEDYVEHTKERITSLEREIDMLTRYADARENTFSRLKPQEPDNRQSAPVVQSGSSGNEASSSSRVSGWQLELAAMRELYETENDLRSMSLNKELEYWMSKRRQSDLSAKEEIALDQKISQTHVAIQKEKLETDKKLTQEAVEERKRVELAGVEQRRILFDLELEYGNISKQDRIRLEQQLQNEIYEIKKQALLDSQVLNQEDLLSQEQHKNALLELERQHELEKAKLQLKSGSENTSGDNYFEALEGDFQNFGTNLLTSTDTIYSQINALARNAGNSMVKELVVKPMAQWLASQLKKMAMMAGFFGQERAMNAAASSDSIAKTASTALAGISAKGAEAAAGAASSQASIPYIGPILAAAAAASTLAMVLGFRSQVKSARGGYDIPSGVNPLTQLHEEEMVLPKEQANAVRDMASGGSSQTVVNLGGVDAGEFLMVNKKSLARAMRAVARDNMLSVR